jgi:hypothetical protein
MRGPLLVASAVGLALAAHAQQQMQGQMAPMKGEMAMPTTTGSLRVIAPANGARITTSDITAKVAVSNFRVSGEAAGRPDVPNEGHIHVMVDGMTMGKLFNFYTTPDFTLPRRGLAPGQHTLIFDLASNTHEDFENTAQKVSINYQPRSAAAMPAPYPNARPPEVKITSPADGATVGPKFTVTTQTPSFRPDLSMEGKDNVPGYGHLHVFVDMKMEEMKPGEMMSMAGMVGMPGENTFPVDLSGWPAGPHTLTVEAVQDDHTDIPGAKPAMIHINLKK